MPRCSPSRPPSPWPTCCRIRAWASWLAASRHAFNALARPASLSVRRRGRWPNWSMSLRRPLHGRRRARAGGRLRLGTVRSGPLANRLAAEARRRSTAPIATATRIFNDLNFGGFLIYHAPRLRVFVDDRCSLYGGEFLGAYDRARREDPAQIDRWQRTVRLPLRLGRDRQAVRPLPGRNQAHWELLGRHAGGNALPSHVWASGHRCGRMIVTDAFSRRTLSAVLRSSTSCRPNAADKSASYNGTSRNLCSR